MLANASVFILVVFRLMWLIHEALRDEEIEFSSCIVA